MGQDVASEFSDAGMHQKIRWKIYSRYMSEILTTFGHISPVSKNEVELESNLNYRKQLLIYYVGSRS